MFQNQPFIDPLQNRCYWIIHKIHWKKPVLESLFIKEDSDRDAFLWNLQTFKNNYCEDHLWMSTSKLHLKSDSHFQKKLCYLLDWKPVKNDEKCFLFHLKSSFVLHTYLSFCHDFLVVGKTAWLRWFYTRQNVSGMLQWHLFFLVLHMRKCFVY